MDSNSEDGEYQNVEHAQYRVTYPHGRNTKDVSWWHIIIHTPFAAYCVIYHLAKCIFICRWITVRMRSSTKRGRSLHVYIKTSAWCDLIFNRIYTELLTLPAQVSGESLWQQPGQSEAGRVMQEEDPSSDGGSEEAARDWEDVRCCKQGEWDELPAGRATGDIWHGPMGVPSEWQ